MPRPDEGMIHAWLDGELDAAEAARVEQLVETDPEWGAVAAEARGLVAASSRIVGALDVVPDGVIPAGSKAGHATAKTSRFSVRPWMRMAAGLALVAGTAYAARTRFADIGELPVAKSAPSSVLADSPAVAGTVAAPETPAPAPARPAPARSATVGVAGTIAAGTGAQDRQREATPPAPARAQARPDASAPVDQLASAVAEITRSEDSLRKAMVASRAVDDSSRAERLRRLQNSELRLSEVVVTGVAEPPRDSTLARAQPRRAAAEPTREAAAKSAGTAALRPRIVIDREGNALGGLFNASALEGCWRTRTTAAVDSVLVNPRVVAMHRDTLLVAFIPLSEGRRAVLFPETIRVVRRGADELRGLANDRDGNPVAFTATRITCP